jgi:hypothetical protein
MLDATFCGDAGAVEAKPCSKGPGNFPNNDPPSADDDVSVLPGGTAVPSLESAVVPKFFSTSLLRGPYQKIGIQCSRIRTRPRKTVVRVCVV